MGPFRVMDRGWDLEAGDHNLVCFAALSASFIFSIILRHLQSSWLRGNRQSPSEYCNHTTES